MVGNVNNLKIMCISILCFSNIGHHSLNCVFNMFVIYVTCIYLVYRTYGGGISFTHYSHPSGTFDPDFLSKVPVLPLPFHSLSCFVRVFCVFSLWYFSCFFITDSVLQVAEDTTGPELVISTYSKNENNHTVTGASLTIKRLQAVAVKDKWLVSSE